MRRGSRAVEGLYGIRIGTSSREDDDQIWVSIFDICVGFSLSYRDNKNTQNAKKCETSSSHVLHIWIRVCLFFFPCFVCYLIYFILLVKCPFGQVWEEITGSTPLDDRPNQQTGPAFYFTIKRQVMNQNNFSKTFSIKGYQQVSRGLML